ncbi:MAG: hypothetical protein ACXWWC_05600 [Chitinophagaceae bacterium]
MTFIVNTTMTAGSLGQQEKLIYSYGYNSKNNVGTVVIDASKFKQAGIGYTVDTTVKTDFYENGILTDSYESSFQSNMPPYSGTFPYNAIGTDSIFFASGFISLQSPDSTSMPIATTAAGYKISWLSDTLVMKMQQSNSSIQNVNGVNAQVANNYSQTVKLKRK